ncbi:hypothetical protein B5M09_000708 [Aphanomyces astaci]|uniref:Uncharacterized protein n=1 Tax=Aphanomyces astaci TaxID=112090 RepID=A0A425D1Y8_APHAT|nr:hypothetical protein B5M09_000708 [Aphanomyces astaci]
MLTLGESHPPSTSTVNEASPHPTTPAKHTRSRSFSISELTVSHLLDDAPPPPKTVGNPRVKTKWKTLGEHLWHQKSKMLLNALILTPPRHLYIERKNEVQNPLVHDGEPPSISNTDDNTNFDTFIAGYFRNMSFTAKPLQTQPNRRRSSTNTINRRESTETKWSRWRRYPPNKRPEWPATSPTKRHLSGGRVSYADYLAHGNSYRQRAGLKEHLLQC